MAAIVAKVTQIGNSVGIVLTKEVLERLNVAKGDSLILLETESGYALSAYDPEVIEELALAREVGKQYRHTLRELAK